MADKKTGPVKPPTLDMTARDNEKKAGADKAAETPNPSRTAPKPEGTTDTASADRDKGRPASAGNPEPKPAPDKVEASGSAKDTSGPTNPKAGGAGTTTGATRTASSSNAKTGAPRTSGEGNGQARAGQVLATTAIAGIAGALGGAAIAYGLAFFGFWPAPPQQPAIDALENRLAQVEGTTAEVSETQSVATDQADALRSDLEARLGTLEADLAEAVSLETVAPQTVEALANEVGELAMRIEAIGAGASGQEAEEFGTMLTDLRADIDALSQQVAQAPQIEDLADRIAGIEPRIDTLESAIADQPDIEAALAERDRFAQLPGLSAQLETALETGAPFAQSLSALEALLPQLELDQRTRTVGAVGAPTVSDIVTRFRTELPDIIAARPRPDSPGWFEDLLDQARAAVAFRAAGDIEGEDPDARLARLEAALETGDLERAADELAALPQPMQSAAGGTSDLVADRLAAQTLLQDVRTFSGSAGATQPETDS